MTGSILNEAILDSKLLDGGPWLESHLLGRKSTELQVSTE